MLVVLHHETKPEERAEVKERAIAVGAELVVAPNLPSPEDVVAVVREAGIAVLDRGPSVTRPPDDPRQD
jgi:hypothetical protein